jgi:ABC-type dipeptide/oligopeptide/nickel transport system ATPase component
LKIGEYIFINKNQLLKLATLISKEPINFSEFINQQTHDFIGREWIFKSLNNFLKNDNREIYAIIGEPGSGKTSIASKLSQFSDGLDKNKIKECNFIKQGFISAKHFCSAKYPKWTNPISFCESIALQLSQQDDEYNRVLITTPKIQMNITMEEIHAKTATGIIIQNLVLNERSAEDVFANLISEPLQKLYNSNPQKKFILLILG